MFYIHKKRSLWKQVSMVGGTGLGLCWWFYSVWYIFVQCVYDIISSFVSWRWFCLCWPFAHINSSNIHSSICQHKCCKWRWKLTVVLYLSVTLKIQCGSERHTYTQTHIHILALWARQPLSNYCRSGQALCWDTPWTLHREAAEYAAEWSVPTANRCRPRG